MTQYIESRKNPLIAHLRKLQTGGSYRRETGEYLCDGVKLLEEAVRWNAEITCVVTAKGREADLPQELRHIEVPDDVMESVSPMQSPQGVLFTCRLPDTALPKTLTGERYLVLDGVQDPGNVGTIWRTADALGAGGLILVNDCCDPFGHKVVRASMGAAFRLPVYECTPEKLQETLGAAGLPLYATALREDTVSLRGFGEKRCCVVIGSEGKGVSDGVLSRCTKTIKIPMEPQCESLNAATAAALVLWELYRA
ncbi:MAG: RNA methyltransferase [Oscillospiraceae bacterium]